MGVLQILGVHYRGTLWADQGVKFNSDPRPVETRPQLALSDPFGRISKMADFQKNTKAIAWGVLQILGVHYRGTLWADQGVKFNSDTRPVETRPQLTLSDPFGRISKKADVSTKKNVAS